MAVDISKVISLVAQRIVPAPPQVDPPVKRGLATAETSYKEAYISEQYFRSWLQGQGYGPTEIASGLEEAKLRREFDQLTDELAAIHEGYDKEALTYEAMKFEVMRRLRDDEKALVIVNLWEIQKRPTPKVVPPEKVPELTVAQLIAAFRAGVLPEALLRAEMAERRYTRADIDTLVATEIAKLPKPAEAKQAQLSLADLRALFDLAQISAAEFRAQLLRRTYIPEDAERIINLQLARQRAKVPVPKPAAVKELPLGDLKSMLSLGIITPEEFYLELLERKYSAEDAKRETLLLLAKMEPRPAPARVATLSLADLQAAYLSDIISETDLRLELATRGYSPEDIVVKIALLEARRK